MAGPIPDDWSVDPASAGAREVAPGLWRLRLPMAWDGNAHANAFAVAGDDGVVLFDCGTAGHETNVLALDVALAAAGMRIDDVTLLVGTHTHSDHVGLAADVIARSGCAFWMHPESGSFYDGHRDPGRIRALRERLARREGVPADRLGDFASTDEETKAILRDVAPDRPLVGGDRVPSGLGTWEVIETPGHAPSHLSFLQREHGYLVVGDVLCSAFAPWYDLGYSPDPYAEWQASLDVLDAIGPFSLVLPGHGRPIGDARDAIEAHRSGMRQELRAVRDALDAGPANAWDLCRRIFGDLGDGLDGVWRMDCTLAYLRHLQVTGVVVREATDERITHRLA